MALSVQCETGSEIALLSGAPETPMTRISYKRHRLPSTVIRHAVWLYFRFTLSLRDVEEMLAQRGIDVSYETIRCWTIKFGPKIAANLRRRKQPPSPHQRLVEMVCTIGGERVYLWRTVDDEGEVMALCEDANARCSDSNRETQRSAFSKLMLRSTTPSPFNGT